MVIVAFQPGEKYAVNYTTLDQYDYGQILRIQGLKLPKTVEVHFSTQETGGTSITRVGVTKDGVTDVLIPDSVLENGDTTQNYSIFAFVYITDATSGKTEYRAKLEVKARPKPEVPGGSDNPDVFRDAVLAVRESALKAEEAQRQADEDAKKTTEDRKAVEHAVESVKDITEQVARVEELSRNAQEAATQTQNAAQGIITDREQINTNKAGVAQLKEDLKQLEQNGTGTGTGLSTDAIDKLEEVGNYLAYTTADGGSKWTELISILRNGSSGSGSGETSEPVYQLASATTFDGTNCVDTDVVLDYINKDLTICVDWTPSAKNGYVFDASADTTTYGLALRCTNNWSWNTLICATGVSVSTVVTRQRLIITHEANSLDFKHYWIEDGGSSITENTVTINANNLRDLNSSDNFVRLGQQTKSANHPYSGTINTLLIYERVLTSDEINSYMGV